MQLAPIGISDLVAAGVRSFPIAQPVADVVRASNSATTQLSPTIALQRASTTQSQASVNSATGQDFAQSNTDQLRVQRDEFTPSLNNPLSNLLTRANVNRPQPSGVERLNSGAQLIANTNSSLPNNELGAEVELARAPSPETTPQIAGAPTANEVPLQSIARAPESTPVVGQSATDSELPEIELARAPEATPAINTGTSSSDNIVRPSVDRQVVENPRTSEEPPPLERPEIPRGNIEDRLAQTFLGGSDLSEGFSVVA